MLDGKAVAKSSGTTIQYSTLSILIFNIVLTFFFTISIAIIFPIFNFIQLILFIPLLELELPKNFRLFITDYLQFVNFNFEFLYNLFHDWGIIDLSEIRENPLNENFLINDIRSRAFIINYGGQFMIWLIILFLYFPITFIAKTCKFKMFIQLKKSYEFGVLLTTFIESFLGLSLFSVLNITHVNYSYLYVLYIYIYI